MDKYDVFQSVKGANESDIVKDFKSRVRFDVNVSSQTGEVEEFVAINNYYVISNSFSQFLLFLLLDDSSIIVVHHFLH